MLAITMSMPAVPVGS